MDRNYYINIFNNCEQFGLPHGNGWANELPWIIDLLTEMKSAKQSIELWLSRGRK